MKTSLIVAMAEDNVIGINNQLPWHLPEDLKFFKRVTMAKPVIMGRKTFESIGRPLPGRQNIVITRQTDLTFEGADVVSSLESAIDLAKQDAAIEEVMIIGGAEIYSQALNLVDQMYITHVDLNIEGDAFFPEVDWSAYELIEEEPHSAEDDKPAYKFCTYQRR